MACHSAGLRTDEGDWKGIGEMKLLMVALTALAAGFIQGVAGFGSGPVQMMTYTLIWQLPAAAAVSVCVSVPLNLNMLLTYKNDLHWKKVLIPAVPYMIICSAAIGASRYFDQAVMKKVFGVFLILLSAYYLFFDKRENRSFSTVKTLIYISVSALCDALFGIGGPLMVLYFLSVTGSKEEYLGTAAAFFLINGVYNSIIRIFSGILTSGQIPYILTGIAAILAGVTLSHKAVDRLDEGMLRNITYLTIGLTGIFNLIS